MKTFKYVLVLIIFGALMWWVLQSNKTEPRETEVNNTEVSVIPDVANMTFYVDGEIFALKNGEAEISIPGSSAKSLLNLFGQEYGDLDADGDIDSAVWLVNDGGGTGRFFYGALVINNGDSTYKSTNAMYLGDRIAPQNIEIKDGRAVYNFAERRADEPMTAEPSIGKSVWVNFDKKTGEIGEWVKDFEGEADPARMSLDMKTWQWISTSYSDGTKIVPKDSKRFSLSFESDNAFFASTDCNGVGGNFTVKDNKITFSNMMMTQMYCEGSQESDFVKALTDSESFSFTSKGELILNLKSGIGFSTFR
jgi:heat shock protein HslJ